MSAVAGMRVWPFRPDRDTSEVRVCRRCGEERWTAEFRILSPGWRASMDWECELDYDRDRKRRRATTRGVK